MKPALLVLTLLAAPPVVELAAGAAPSPYLRQLVELVSGDVVSSTTCKPGGVCRVGGLVVSSSSSSCASFDTNVLKVDCSNNRVGVNMTPATGAALDVTGATRGTNSTASGAATFVATANAGFYAHEFAIRSGANDEAWLGYYGPALNPTLGSRATSIWIDVPLDLGIGCLTDGRCDVGVSGRQFRQGLFTGVVTSGGLNPATNNTKDIGTTALRWRYLYGGELDLDGVTLRQTGSDFIFSRGALGAGAGDLNPALDSVQDVGATGQEWAEGHFDDLYEGTDTVLSSNNSNGRATFAWSATCFGTNCSEDTNFQGPLHNVAADSVRIGCSWATAGAGGTTGVVVSIYDVTGAAQVCSCTLQACTAAAGTPANCSCTGSLVATNQYAVRLASGTDCTAGNNPGDVVCTVTLEN